MKYTNILFYNFRNIVNAAIALDSDCVLLIGNNAQGKTNFLEAIYMLAYGTSFRTARFDEIKTFHKDECSLNATMVDEEGVAHSAHVAYSNRCKEIRLNNNKITDRKQLLHHNPTIIFSHNDYGLVVDGHERRRNFFDQIQCFISLQYVDSIRNYNRVLRQRNRALKERYYGRDGHSGNRDSVLDAYNHQLATYGLEIMRQREQCIALCSRHARDIFNDISSEGQDLRLRYSPSWDVDDDVAAIVKRLEERIGDDLKNGYSGSGPHRDRILFYIGGKTAAYASTGQIRSVALIVKVVQSVIIFEFLGKKPMLLFDDVLLELDNKREEGILAQLPQVSQLFFTFLPHKETKSPYLHHPQRIAVKNGTLSSY